jgi:anti-sigma B factor antagonist
MNSNSGLLIDRARAALDASRALLGAVHERRRQSIEVFVRLARLNARLGRFVPVTGAASGVPLGVETEDRPEGHVIRVAGEIDLGNVAVLRAALEPAVKNSQSVVLDLSRVTYLDSTTLHTIVISDRELSTHHCRLVVVGPPFLFKLIQITGLQRHLTVVPSMDDATQMLVGGDAS